MENLWKEFGRETDVGKMLYSMYSAPNKPQINYPAVRTKTKEQIAKEEFDRKATKKCPQRATVDVPDPVKRPQHKFHPIDFVPKRKPVSEIEEERKKQPLSQPAPRKGGNRQRMINDLQEKF